VATDEDRAKRKQRAETTRTLKKGFSRLPTGWENLTLQGKIALLEPRMKDWLRIYTETSNAAKATADCFPNMNKNSVSAYSTRIKARPIIKAIMQEMGAKIGLSRNSVLTALHEEIFLKENNTPGQRAIRLNAIDKTAKIMGWYDNDNKGVQGLAGLPQVVDYKRGEELTDGPVIQELPTATEVLNSSNEEAKDVFEEVTQDIIVKETNG